MKLGKVKRLSREIADQLVDAVASGDRDRAEGATKRFFREVVEPLNDSFADDDRDTYYKIFSPLIQAIRDLPQARLIDEQLKEFSLLTANDLIKRIKKLIVLTKADTSSRQRVKKVLVLSRVTIGADIAITSIMIERLKRVFPQARIVLLGQKKLAEIFGQDERIHIHPFNYNRRGDLVSRLTGWLDALTAISKETGGQEPCESVVIDPKSRITQLGLLPVRKGDSGYYLFEPIKRSESQDNTIIKRLGEDANEWLDEVFGEMAGSHVFPNVSVPGKYIKAAGEFLQGTGLNHSTLVAINFGVGGNNEKRVGSEFECAIIQHLLASGAAIILDKGFGQDEIDRANRMIAKFRKQGKGIIEVQEDLSTVRQSQKSPHLVVYQGSIGPFAGLISQSRLYLGYDSMGQHLAAARGVAERVVFNGHPSKTFLQKWHPFGKGAIKVIDAKGKRQAEVLAQTRQYLESLKKNFF